MTGKEYKEGKVHTVAIENNRDYVNWILDKCPSLLTYTQHLLLRDNRDTFRKLFGKPNWYFRGSEFYFHVWVREHDGETYLLMTAKGKGTCIEMVRPKYKGIEDQSDKIIAFINSLLDQMEK